MMSILSFVFAIQHVSWSGIVPVSCEAVCRKLVVGAPGWTEGWLVIKVRPIAKGEEH